MKNTSTVSVKAQAIMNNLSMEQLVDTWERTKTRNHPDIYTVRFWLLSEFAKRNWAGYEAWRSQENRKDEDLRKYML